MTTATETKIEECRKAIVGTRDELDAAINKYELAQLFGDHTDTESARVAIANASSRYLLAQRAYSLAT